MCNLRNELCGRLKFVAPFVLPILTLVKTLRLLEPLSALFSKEAHFSESIWSKYTVHAKKKTYNISISTFRFLRAGRIFPLKYIPLERFMEWKYWICQKYFFDLKQGDMKFARSNSGNCLTRYDKLASISFVHVVFRCLYAYGDENMVLGCRNTFTYRDCTATDTVRQQVE